MAKGQKSLTLSQSLHSKLTEVWEKNQVKLEKRYSVSTFTGYAQQLIERGLEEDLLESRFEIVNRFENEIRVRDYFLVRDAVVKLNVEGPYAVVYCELDRTGKCPHVGYVLSDAEVLKAAKQHGVSLRRSPRSVGVEEAQERFEKALGSSSSGGEELSDKEFIEKVISQTSYDQAQAREMLKTLYSDYRIVISREHAGVYYFRRA